MKKIIQNEQETVFLLCRTYPASDNKQHKLGKTNVFAFEAWTIDIYLRATQ